MELEVRVGGYNAAGVGAVGVGAGVGGVGNGRGYGGHGHGQGGKGGGVMPWLSDVQPGGELLFFSYDGILGLWVNTGNGIAVRTASPNVVLTKGGRVRGTFFSSHFTSPSISHSHFPPIPSSTQLNTILIITPLTDNVYSAGKSHSVNHMSYPPY